MRSGLQIAVDIGGTFTDVVGRDASGVSSDIIF